MSRPTPGTAVRRLEAAGLRSLGSLVDATNYVLLELGHPVHIFDRAALSGSKVFVRRARQGESLVALDGRRLDLDPQDLVIADSRAPVALAGVIGGRDSGVREGTRDVFLECAAFDPAAVRASSRRLGLSTDSSARFERRVPAAGLPLALARLAQLTAEWSGAEPDGFVAAEGDVKDRRTLIPFDPERAAAWLGYEDPKPKAAVIPALFQTLGLSVGGKPPVYEVSVPYYRPDLRIPEDLYEEAARTLGLDDLPETLPGGRLPRPRRDPLAEWTAEARRVLSGLGFQEAVSLPFQEDAGTGHGGADGASLAVVNPLQKGAGSLRAALVPGLIRAAAHNMARGVYDLRLFETGVVFQAGEAGSAPREEVRLAGLAAGGAHPDSWGEERPADLFDLRGMVEVLASRLRLPLEWVSDGSASGAPGARWSLRAGGAPLGWAGRAVPPRGLLPKNAPPVYAFELSLTRGLGRRASRAAAEGPPRFPAVGRDVNFVVPDSVPAANLEDLIRKAAGGDLESVRLRDLYRGRQVPEGFRSLTYALVFRAGDRTLVESDVDGRMAAVLAAAERDLGVRIRS
jgi:phenylalanyl-tRNA synthetase beta chain